MSTEKDDTQDSEEGEPQGGEKVTNILDYKERLRLAGGTDTGDARILYGSFEDPSQPIVLMRQMYDPEEDKTHCQIEVRLPRRPWYKHPLVIAAGSIIAYEMFRGLINKF